ncbi:hypothetical protein L3Q82_011656, partial [Scortum barcoo]
SSALLGFIVVEGPMMSSSGSGGMENTVEEIIGRCLSFFAAAPQSCLTLTADAHCSGRVGLDGKLNKCTTKPKAVSCGLGVHISISVLSFAQLLPRIEANFIFANFGRCGAGQAVYSGYISFLAKKQLPAVTGNKVVGEGAVAVRQGKQDFNKACRMAQTDSKVLVLGALAGVAGISLAVVCYQGFKSRRRASSPGLYCSRSNEQRTGFMLVDGPGLPQGQAEVLERLEALIQCVSELKDEMKSLKNALPTLQGQVREELRGRSEARRASPLHRTTPTRRKRAAGTLSGPRAEGRSSEEAESEGGYMTALTDSEEEESNDAEQGDDEQPADELFLLLERIDRLHHGSEYDKRESLSILLEQREEFGQTSTFLWRLIRAYCDVHDVSSSLEEKKTHAEAGKAVGEEAVSLNPTCAESHQWYAIMCGIMAEYDTIQNKIKNGYIFKDHLDKAIELKPQDPMSYYLLGRWCYAVCDTHCATHIALIALYNTHLKHCVKEAKDSYRRKVEQKLRENNMREVWEGVKTITGLNTKTRAVVGGTMERANELNEFFNRFNQSLPPPPPPSPQPPRPLSPPHTSPQTPQHHPPPPPHQHSLHHSSPLTRRWALERLFLSLLRPQVQHAQDRLQLQFAYQPGVGVEDAILYLLHRAHSHLDKGSAAHPLCSSGQTEQDGSGPPADGLDLRLPHWQTTVVRRAEGHHTSDTVVSSTGAPQGTVLAPLLFTLYTSDFCYNSELCHIQKKYADDTAIVVGCIRDDREEESEIGNCVLFYTVVCWGGSISKKDTSRLDKLIRRAGSVVRHEAGLSLVTVAESRTLDKLCWILWTMPATLCTPSSATRGACSVKDCSFPSAGPTGSRTPLSIMPSHSTTPHKGGGGGHRVAQLSWIERKVAATLFGDPPNATVEDALKNFVKVEEIQPGYSKLNYVFLAKCYKDLGQRDKARKMCEAACSMNTVSKEDEEAQKELDLLCPALGV